MDVGGVPSGRKTGAVDASRVKVLKGTVPFAGKAETIKPPDIGQGVVTKRRIEEPRSKLRGMRSL